jgi:hypothetical protein
MSAPATASNEINQSAVATTSHDINATAHVP